jgi:hypothetical protein
MTFPFAVTVTSAKITTGIGDVSGFSASGAQVTVNLTGVANAQTIVLTLGTNAGSAMVSIGVLLGDTTGNGSVTSTDIGQTKAGSGQAVTGSNFRLDVTASGGTINSSDIGLVKSNSGAQLLP